MRKISQQGIEEETAIDITPLIDIVFIMLIFFIVTATFVKEPGTTVDKPTAITADPKPRANILIAIDSADGVWIDRRRIDPRAVKPSIERLLSENPNGSVIIQADNKSTNEALVLVMDAAREAGVANVAISALEE
ncbi:MAG: biopolymer transporter ExbD [Gammaproteobacteria bacterium]|nr:biopolymer transporter ExbD [Gammaproteobacteria bacterium]